MLPRVIGALVSGGVLCLAFPTFDLWFLAPVSLGLLVLVLTGVRAWAAFGLGLLAGLAFFVPTLHWSGVYVGNLPWFALSTLQALFFGLAGALYAWLGRSGQVRPVVFALVWVVSEGLRARAPYGGFPWVKLAFSQADGPFGPLAAVGGAPLVGFVLALTGGLLAVVGSRARRRMPLRSLALPAALAVGLALSGLAVPLPTGGPTANFVGVQGNVPRPGLDFNAERRAVLDNHVNATLAAAAELASGEDPVPDLYVWPENASDIDPLRNEDANQLIRNTVAQTGVPLVVGGLLEEPEGYVSNVSLLFEPGRGDTDRYVKLHPVPFGEYIPNRDFWRTFSDKVDLVRRDFYPGSEVGVFTVPTASGQQIRAGLSICFEVAYDDIMRDVVDAGANVLVVQTNNATFGYTAESPQQLAISRVRAMELGRSVIHVSTVGQSALITPDGTPHQVTSLFTQAVVRGALPLRDSRTLALRLGEAPELVAALGVLAVAVVTTRRRPARRPDRPGDTTTKDENDHTRA
ncbi:apolipoprotein N-acyltransferase [Intrasporangium sp.]|uniref:apolipoprotein N-acyltransferase n=1 Tax=Intrasporangium sp. TaxID=1925024 RepID=UPI00293A60C9|nr:apolipoprotein N-acyltransferase [Intrasporangium sp.]MDV3222806.1 apolipoprotein N-acyltransferase [Intrasporangium sp.]